jgi:hypothetical protein
VVEQLRVVMHGHFTLLEVRELLALPSHHACWNVVCAEGIVELSPQHLVVCGASGGVVGPPCAVVTTQLLHDKESSPSPCNVGAQTWTRSREANDRPQEALLPW